MIITQTPLRISFFGGGTDFRDYYRENQGGAVLSTAIDKYIYVIVKERFDDLICVNYTKREVATHLEEVQHELVKEAMRKTGVKKGVEITTLADIPAKGTGLGSSSSVTVGLLNVFYLYQSCPQPIGRLAKEACEIEIDILRKPMGKQDQYAAAFANLNIIRFYPDETVTLEPLSIEKRVKSALEASLMLIYTGVTRQSSDILSQQKDNIRHHASILDEMKAMVDEGKSHLLQGRLDEFGRLLHRGWELKRKLAERVSNPQIEKMYQIALEAGALGGKICGAGGGGFLLLYCPFLRQDRVRDALRSPRELPWHFERQGTKAIFNVRK